MTTTIDDEATEMMMKLANRLFGIKDPRLEPADDDTVDESETLAEVTTEKVPQSGDADDSAEGEADDDAGGAAEGDAEGAAGDDAEDDNDNVAVAEPEPKPTKGAGRKKIEIAKKPIPQSLKPLPLTRATRDMSEDEKKAHTRFRARVKYYMKKGMTEDQAIEHIRERDAGKTIKIQSHASPRIIVKKPIRTRTKKAEPEPEPAPAKKVKPAPEPAPAKKPEPPSKPAGPVKYVNPWSRLKMA